MDGTFTLAFGASLPGKASASVTQTLTLTFFATLSNYPIFTQSWDTSGCTDVAVQILATTGPIPFNASAELLSRNLVALLNFGPGAAIVTSSGVSLSGATSQTHSWTIAFTPSAFLALTQCTMPTLTPGSSVLPTLLALPSGAVTQTALRVVGGDWTAMLRRCDTIKVGLDVFTIHKSIAPFSPTSVPLAMAGDCSTPAIFTRGPITSTTAFYTSTTIPLSSWDPASLVQDALNALPTSPPSLSLRPLPPSGQPLQPSTSPSPLPMTPLGISPRVTRTPTPRAATVCGTSSPSPSTSTSSTLSNTVSGRHSVSLSPRGTKSFFFFSFTSTSQACKSYPVTLSLSTPTTLTAKWDAVCSSG
jgi:hypothetical protein